MKTKIISFILLLAVSVGHLFASVQIGNLYYDLKEATKTAEVTQMPNGKYNGSITIPSSIGYENLTYNVTSIGDYAFYKCSGLTKVIIPNSVTSIGNYAFFDCIGLTSITIPNSVTCIGESVFQNCFSLKSVTIPESVTSIETSAFEDCSGLTKVIIPNSVTSIGGWAFAKCSSLTSITNYATTPQIIWGGVFYMINKNTCTLYVPKGSLNAYKTTDVWKDFYNIVGIDAPEGIANTTIDVQPGTKIIKDGQILILRGDKTYTLTGAVVK